MVNVEEVFKKYKVFFLVWIIFFEIFKVNELKYKWYVFVVMYCDGMWWNGFVILVVNWNSG